MASALELPIRLPNMLAGMRFKLSGRAFSIITSEAKASADGLETGGILLGHDYEGDDLIEVTQAGDAGPRAKRERRSFLRDLKHARRLADVAYEDDGSVWIGEWHTHTNESPLPSPRDLSTYLQLLDDPSLEFSRFASIIVTAESEDWDDLVLWPWVITPTVVQLALFSSDGTRG